MADVSIHNIPGGLLRFGTVLEFSVCRVTDLESWLPRYDGSLLLADEEEKFRLRLTLTGVTGDWSISIGQGISGLQILDNKEYGFEDAARYHIRDFECGEIDLFCRDIQKLYSQPGDAGWPRDFFVLQGKKPQEYLVYFKVF